MNNRLTVFCWLTTERLLLLIIAAAAGMGISGYSSDLFLHLSAGRYLLDMGELPRVDPFSFTRAGDVWVMHEWLYQLTVYAIYATAGITGLKIFGGMLFASTLYINKRSCELLGASWVTSWVVVILLLVTWNEFIGIRPQAITYLLFSGSLHILLRYRYLGDAKSIYLLPPIMIVWVNCHGGFMAGMALLAHFVILQGVDNRLGSENRRPLLPLIATLGMTLAASLINPYGYEQLLFPFRLMGSWAMAYITEWQPPDYHLWYYLLFLVIVLLYVVASLLYKRERWYRLTFPLPLLMASLLSVRHIPIASLALAPYLASLAHNLVSRRNISSRGAVERKELGRAEYVLNWIVFVAFCAATFIIYPRYEKSQDYAARLRFPINATRYLMTNDFHGRLFTTMEYSDYILFHRYPRQRLFYDVRIEFYGEVLSRDYLTMVNALDGWKPLFAKYAIDYAVLDKSVPIYRAVVESGRFRTLFEDDISAIVVPMN